MGFCSVHEWRSKSETSGNAPSLSVVFDALNGASAVIRWWNTNGGCTCPAIHSLCSAHQLSRQRATPARAGIPAKGKTWKGESLLRAERLFVKDWATGSEYDPFKSVDNDRKSIRAVFGNKPRSQQWSRCILLPLEPPRRYFRKQQHEHAN